MSAPTPLFSSSPGGFFAQGTERSAILTRILNFENMMHRRFGQVRPMRYVRLYNYYTSQNLPPDNVEQPLGINYFKPICDKHVSYLWGQWQDDLFTYRTKKRGNPDSEEDETGAKIQGHLNSFLRANNHNVVCWEGARNGSVYGDTLFRLRWDPIQRRVVFESLLPEWFHARWDTADMNQLTEVIICYPISREDAQQQFGTAGNDAFDYSMVNPLYLPGFGIYWEHWTPLSYRRWIDDCCITDDVNPYAFTDEQGQSYGGIIPFIHVPNMRIGGEYYGFSDGENILLLQDELNRRMADMGDDVNNHAHPITLLSKFHGNQSDLPIGPDAVWDMGSEGTAEYLEAKGKNDNVMQYVAECKQMMYDMAQMPEVAFGKGVRGGGNSNGKSGTSSGLALQMAMMPVVERSKEKRIWWGMGLQRMADMAVIIHSIEDPASLPFKIEQYQQYDVQPVWASILPRDRLQLVNENVALASSNLRSIERALQDLGEDHIGPEYKRIKADARFKAALMAKPQQPAGGKNSDRGMGGSPGLPGPGASNRRPGAPAKSAF